MADIDVTATVSQVTEGRVYRGEIGISESSYRYRIKFPRHIAGYTQTGLVGAMWSDLPLYVAGDGQPGLLDDDKTRAFFSAVAGSSAAHFYADPDNREPSRIPALLRYLGVGLQTEVKFQYKIPEKIVPARFLQLFKDRAQNI